MLFSCKITNSVLTYLEKKGEDINPLLEATNLSEDRLHDTAAWMDADELEVFLTRAEKIYNHKDLVSEIAHAGPELRGWGVLDSVLRMTPEPHELFFQPQRLLSHFVSPPPPIENLQRFESSISFDLALTSLQFPLVTNYLRASFESLPCYVGKSQMEVKWDGIHVEVTWQQKQNSLFGGEEVGHQVSPELLKSVVASLEKNQKDLEEKNLELEKKNSELVVSQARVQNESLDQLRNRISSLSDYMVRAQQLITLLVAQDRMNPTVKAAMKRMDWERVQSQFPTTVQECHKILEEGSNVRNH